MGRQSRDPEKPSPFEFLQEVRAEAAKVTWPTRKETLVTTGMVFAHGGRREPVLPSSSDQIIRWVVGLVLGIGR